MIKGIRIYPNKSGFLNVFDMQVCGAYGKTSMGADPKRPHTWWQVVTPNGDAISLNPKIHTVEEHKDGTITVKPSIVSKSWHGFLEKGVWRPV